MVTSCCTTVSYTVYASVIVLDHFIVLDIFIKLSETSNFLGYNMMTMDKKKQAYMSATKAFQIPISHVLLSSMRSSQTRKLFQIITSCPLLGNQSPEPGAGIRFYSSGAGLHAFSSEYKMDASHTI